MAELNSAVCQIHILFVFLLEVIIKLNPIRAVKEDVRNVKSELQNIAAGKSLVHDTVKKIDINLSYIGSRFLHVKCRMYIA